LFIILIIVLFFNLPRATHDFAGILGLGEKWVRNGEMGSGAIYEMFNAAAGLGFGPRYSPPGGDVLPLDDPAL